MTFVKNISVTNITTIVVVITIPVNKYRTTNLSKPKDITIKLWSIKQWLILVISHNIYIHTFQVGSLYIIRLQYFGF